MGNGEVGDRAAAVGYRVRFRDDRLVLDAWSPNRAECVAQAVRGLVEGVVRSGVTAPCEQTVEWIRPESDPDLLAGALRRVITRLETCGQVPADIEIVEDADGGVTLVMVMVQVAEVNVLPVAAPVADDVVFEHVGGGWRCHVIVDVRAGEHAWRRIPGGE